MEHDIYRAQKKVWKMINKNKKEMNEFVSKNKITIEEWEDFFGNLYTSTICPNVEPLAQKIDDIFFSTEEIEKEVKTLKNRKSPGHDNISNEMLKYGGGELVLKITQMFQNILTQCEIPKSWKESFIIPIFKKGSKA